LTVPIVKFFEFDTSDPDPRLTNYAGSLKELNETDAGSLSFGSVNLDTSASSDTKAVLMRATDMGNNLFINNMRFWSPFTISPAAINYNMAIVGSGTWIENIIINSSSGLVPSLLPASQNLFRRDGDPAIGGTTPDEASQWVYLNVSVVSNLAVGNYGGSNGQGVLRYRVTFDYGK